MEILTGAKREEAIRIFLECSKIALSSTCERSKCGSIIVKNGVVIGSGYNSFPNELISQKRCKNRKDSYNKKVTDKTCCVHAEQRAIIDCLKKNTNKINGSKLYFVRLNEENKIIKVSKPYCTICSKMALDVGIENFILWHDNDNICSYNTEEYNDLSYNFDTI